MGCRYELWRFFIRPSAAISGSQLNFQATCGRWRRVWRRKWWSDALGSSEVYKAQALDTEQLIFGSTAGGLGLEMSSSTS